MSVELTFAAALVPVPEDGAGAGAPALGLVDALEEAGLWAFALEELGVAAGVGEGDALVGAAAVLGVGEGVAILGKPTASRSATEGDGGLASDECRKSSPKM